MDSAKICQVVVLLTVLALIRRTDSHVFSHDDARSISGPAPGSFVDSLFEEYGTNKSMSLQQFSSLLKELKLGSITRETTSKTGSAKENGVKNGHSKVGFLRDRILFKMVQFPIRRDASFNMKRLLLNRIS